MLANGRWDLIRRLKFKQKHETVVMRWTIYTEVYSVLAGPYSVLPNLNKLHERFSKCCVIRLCKRCIMGAVIIVC